MLLTVGLIHARDSCDRAHLHIDLGPRRAFRGLPSDLDMNRPSPRSHVVVAACLLSFLGGAAAMTAQEVIVVELKKDR